jgi:hypothetical protein
MIWAFENPFWKADPTINPVSRSLPPNTTRPTILGGRVVGFFAWMLSSITS